MYNLEELQKIFFVGIFGSGMSAIAQYLAVSGKSIGGSDRSLGKDETANIAARLRECGCELFSQNGSGVTPNTDAICVSTAIEDDNPDIAAAKKLNIPILHRSDLLAAIVASKKTIAVAGTSGKSTVTAMIFEFLTACGKSPSLISGAVLRSLEERGLLGNAFCGESDILVIEADESDGTLVKYKPYASVILNLSKDHKPEEEVFLLFEQLANQSEKVFINFDDPKLRPLLDFKTNSKNIIDANVKEGCAEKVFINYDDPKLRPLSDFKAKSKNIIDANVKEGCAEKVFINFDDPKLRPLLDFKAKSKNIIDANVKEGCAFGFDDKADYRGKIIASESLATTVEIENQKYKIPMPGNHNAANLLAALSVCELFGCDKKDLQRATANFKGVDRRFAIHRSPAGVLVIDDFAHNPEKIRAAVCAAQKLSNKLVAVYQPHGFGPTRFLKNEYVQTFCEILRPADALCFLPIYYAGGTAKKDVSSQEIINLIIANGVKFTATAASGKDDAREFIKNQVSDENQNKYKKDAHVCVLIMGARDPSLPMFVKSVAGEL